MSLREIACAAKMRDWDAVDRALEEMRLDACEAVMRGFADARFKMKLEEPMPALDRPSPVTIHDLSPEDRARAKIRGTEGDIRTFTLPPAA